MFHSARIKLTAWYLVIIMLISVIFSVVLYRIVSVELMRFARVQRIRIERQFDGQPLPVPPLPAFDPDLVAEAQQRFLLILIVINVGILVIAGGVGYFLAGQTLKPIQEMVDEQNRFIADASHEFRTPLTALKSSIEVHLRDKKLRMEDVKKLLASNLEEVNHLQTLSDALLELTQFEKANGNYSFKEIQIVDVLDDAVKKIEPLAQKKHIQIHKEVQSHELSADPKALSELFLILLDNAVKYSPEQSAICLCAAGHDATQGIIA